MNDRKESFDKIVKLIYPRCYTKVYPLSLSAHRDVLVQPRVALVCDLNSFEIACVQYVV